MINIRLKIIFKLKWLLTSLKYGATMCYNVS